MNIRDDINIGELVKAVLSEENCSTYAETLPIRKFVPEEQEVYKVSRSLHFGIITPTFVNICPLGA